MFCLYPSSVLSGTREGYTGNPSASVLLSEKVSSISPHDKNCQNVEARAYFMVRMLTGARSVTVKFKSYTEFLNGLCVAWRWRIRAPGHTTRHDPRCMF